MDTTDSHILKNWLEIDLWFHNRWLIEIILVIYKKQKKRGGEAPAPHHKDIDLSHSGLPFVSPISNQVNALTHTPSHTHTQTHTYLHSTFYLDALASAESSVILL